MFLRSFAFILLMPLMALADPPESINLRRTVVVDVVQKVKSAVVNISTTKSVARRVSPFGDDPFWQQFDFGPIQKVPAASLGSGFIIHPSGYVVTNHHVIDRARQITVELADGRKLEAELISSDSDADLAILKIESKEPLPTVELGDSSDLLIGEPVIAVGNPLGYSHSVSTGIVSAIHRDLKDQRGQVMLTDLVQTDAAINPGNSGGPLLNAYGQVIGINTAIRGDAQNIGFAIQVNKLRDLIPELMNPAQVKGIDIPLKLAERRRVMPPSSVECELVMVRDSGERGVVAIEGVRVSNIVDAYALLLSLPQSQKEVRVQFKHGQEVAIAVRPVPLPDAISKARDVLGVVVQQMTPMLSQKYGLATEDGMLIVEVERNSVAARAGLRPGDVIVQLGRYRVRTLDDFSVLLNHLPEHGRVRIGIVREDRVGVGMLEF
jgi:serine protease Do